MPNRLDPDPKVPSYVLSGPGRAYLAYWANLYDLPFSQNRKVTSSNPPHRESVSCRMKWQSVRTSLTANPPGVGLSIRVGQHQPLERTEARMGVRLLGRALLGEWDVLAIKYIL